MYYHTYFSADFLIKQTDQPEELTLSNKFGVGHFRSVGINKIVLGNTPFVQFSKHPTVAHCLINAVQWLISELLDDKLA